MTPPNWEDTFQDGQTFEPRVIDRLKQLGASGVQSVSAADSSIVIGGTATDPTIRASSSGSSDKLGLTPTAVKTTAYSAVVGDFVPVDTTSGAVTVTLPTAPADGSVIAIKMVTQGSTNAVTINCGGSDVFNKTGGVTTASLTLLSQSIILQYKATGAIWYAATGDIPLSGLDLRFQPLDSDLTAIAALTTTSYGRSLLTAADAAAERTTLGLGTLATQSGTFSGTSSGTNTGDQTTVSGNAGTATALATGRTIDGQTFDGTANITVIAPGTHAATSKTTPVDADELSLVDSAASNVLKKLTWANLKATIKAYTDTLYPSGSGTSSGTNTGDQTLPTDATIATTDVTTNNVTSTKHGWAPKSGADATTFLNGAATPAYAAVKDSDLSTTDITTNNASTSKHGFLPKLDNTAAHFLDGTGAWSTPSSGSSSVTRSARSSNTILASGDRGKIISATAAYTQTLTAAATLGSGWWCFIKNETTDGTSVLVVDPNSSETIDSLTTISMYSGETRLLVCDGSNFQSILIDGGFAKFTPTGGTFIVPSGIEICDVTCIGSGGQGGGGFSGTAAASVSGGGGGGGGAVARAILRAPDLGSAGSSITVTVGAGGTGAGAAGGPGTDGGNGAQTTFGTLLKAGGGGGGAKGATVSAGGGGGGSIVNSAATVTSGNPNASSAIGGQSATGGSTAGGNNSEWGGASGGGKATGSAAGSAGGSSMYGGTAGGSGGGATTTVGGNAGAGGATQSYTAGGGGTAGTGGASTVKGGDGTFTGPYCGSAGGGGGAGNTGVTGKDGGVGSIGSGGGGGGASANTTGGAGGVGGAGECRVWFS